MGYEELPNGFLSQPPDDPDFISAGEASRLAREAAQSMADGPADPEFLSRGRFAEHVLEPEPLADAAPIGSYQYARDAESGRLVSNAVSEFDISAVTLDPEQFDPIDLRWAWAEIDLGAVRHNVAVTRSFLDSHCRLLAVVKADAYGHGAVEVAKAALSAGADRLAVATVQEGIVLRKAGITAPILLLSQPPISTAALLVEYAITPSVYEPQFAVAYGEAADQAGKLAPYHLVVNSGMNRIGVHYEDVIEFLYQVSFHRALVLEGTFTHFATADCHESLEFERQRRRFEQAVVNMRAAGFDPGIVHAANSAAIYRYPHVHYDMVRLGIAMYGLHPSYETQGKVDLHPVMSIHGRITDTHVVPMSEGVSYGLQYRSPGSVKICTLPLGYADGLRVGLSGQLDFIMDGRYYRQVGRICMDQCMFEVDLRRRASVPYIDPQVGDHVIVVGQQGAAEITMDELAEKLGTINYEMTIGFGQRLPRIYR